MTIAVMHSNGHIIKLPIVFVDKTVWVLPFLIANEHSQTGRSSSTILQQYMICNYETDS